MSWRKLSETLKNAPDVTTLASTERMLAMNANGEPRKMTLANARYNKVEFRAESKGWWRIAQSTSTQSMMLLHIFNWWGNIQNNSYLLNIMAITTNHFKVDMLLHSNIAASQVLLTKIRYVYKSSSSLNYIDVYYPYANYATPTMHLLASYGMNLLSAPYLVDDEIPEDYKSIEADISAFTDT